MYQCAISNGLNTSLIVFNTGLTILLGVSRRSNLTHPNLSVTKYSESVQPRKLYQLTGVGKDLGLGIYNPDINTLACALLERMYFCKIGSCFTPSPEVNDVHFNSVMLNFKDLVVQNVKFSSPALPHEIVAMYKGRKKAIYQQAMEKFNIYGCNRSDAFSNCFVKVEKGNPSKAPRCIQPRKPVYNLALGCYIKPLEHKIYKAIQTAFQSSTPVVMKGMNLLQVGNAIQTKWSKFKKPVALGLDAVKFDMHCSPQAIMWEHSVYTRLYPGNKTLAKYLKWQLHNVGYGFAKDGKLRYKVLGKRFSGDMNTALGNCLIMCGMVYSYLHHCKIDAYDLANNGDDCTVIIESEDLTKFTNGLEEYFLKLGFRMTVEPPVYNCAEIEFCQMHPIRTDYGCLMVRNIPTSTAKDALSTIPLNTYRALRKWLTAVGECGISVTGGIPVVNAFYRMYLRWGGNIKSNIKNSPQFLSSGFNMLSQGVNTIQSDPIPITRLDVYLAWNIKPDEQVALEQHYNKLNFEYVNMPQIEHLIYKLL